MEKKFAKIKKLNTRIQKELKKCTDTEKSCVKIIKNCARIQRHKKCSKMSKKWRENKN